MNDLEKYLNFLYENDTGYVYSPLKLKSGEWQQKFFMWPAEKQPLMDWITLSYESGNVYIAPAMFSKKDAQRENVKHSNVAWIEFDGQSSIDFKDLPEPDMVVQTSTETHKHCYWKIPQSDSQVIDDINRRITYYLGADGSGWDACQVLRPPMTTNWKHNLPVSLIKCVTPLFKHKLPKFDVAPAVSKPPLYVTYDQLEEASVIIARHKFTAELTKIVTSELAVEPARSTFLMRAGYLLAAAGCNEVEIISLLYAIDFRIKKFTGRSDQLLRLSEIAAIATLESVKELTVEGYSPLEISNHELELEWLIPGWLHSNGIMLVSGAPGVGKTQFCFDLAYRLTTGSSVLGKEKANPVRVGFLSLEMEIVELKYIINHQIKDWDTELIPQWDANFRAYSPDGDHGFQTYEKIIDTFRPQVFIIDSLSELAEDDLKEAEARVIMSWVRRVRKEYDCAIVLIHHNRKASDSNKKPRKLADLYGSYIFGKLSETVVSLWDLEKDNQLEIDSFKVRFGSKAPVRVTRSENLTFEKVEFNINVSGRSGKAGFSNPLLNFNISPNGN